MDINGVWWDSSILESSFHLWISLPSEIGWLASKRKGRRFDVPHGGGSGRFACFSETLGWTLDIDKLDFSKVFLNIF